MRSSILLISLLSILGGTSCKKNTPVIEKSYIRSIATQGNATLSTSILLDDGHVLLSSNYLFQKENADIVKVNPSGEVVWKKRLPGETRVVLKIIKVPGKGFLTMGIRNYPDSTTHLILFDNNGNILKQDSLLSNIPNYLSTHSSLLQLANGNFMIVQGVSEWLKQGFYIRIVNEDLKLTGVRKYYIPDYYHYYTKATCLMPNGDVSIAAFVSQGYEMVINVSLLRLDQKGNLLNSKFYQNSKMSESVNEIYPIGEELLAISAKMTGYSFGQNVGIENNDGVAVNYEDYFWSEPSLISGRVYIRKYDASFNETHTAEIKNYPKNGMLHSVKPTSDGGYIICGTVNQLSTLLIVSDTRIYLLKLNSDLSVQWSKVISTTYPAIGRDAIPLSDGSILVTGYHKAANRSIEPIIIKTDANGNY